MRLIEPMSQEVYEHLSNPSAILGNAGAEERTCVNKCDQAVLETHVSRSAGPSIQERIMSCALYTIWRHQG